jgi:hypothetical protein
LPVESLMSEMTRCKTVEDCFEVATLDAYGEEEQAVGWLTCIQEMSDRFERVNVLGQEVDLEGFDLANDRAVVAICRKGKSKTRIALESVDFSKLSKGESLWLKAWKKWSHA